MSTAQTERLTAALGRSYRVDRELGQGGMATVYLAHDLKHERDVAIKVLHPDLGAALGGERFLSEIRTTARLQHPHILPLLDSGDADGLLYYVMPLVTGETLRARLERERQLPIADALRIAREAASALDYAHRQGVIHRDIKPENILLQDGSAVVADFGIALAVQTAGGARMTQTGLSLGTPQYMSPEQAMGERVIDARSDIYALGAVTYEMLVGEAPFIGSSVQAIVARVLTEEPRSIGVQRKSVTEVVEQAVLRALEKLPADRWATAGEFAAALSDPGAATGHASRPTVARGAATRRGPARLRTLLGFTTGVVLTAAAGALWLTTRTTQQPAASRFDIALPDSVEPYAAGGRRLALSPDGRQLIVVGVKAGTRGLYLRQMDGTEFRLIAGSETSLRDGSVDPMFSPDGTSVLFRAGDDLLRIPVSGGTARRIDAAGNASWVDDGRIVNARRDTVWLTSVDDGARRVLVVANAAAGIPRLRLPAVLPGGRFALVNLRGTRPNAPLDDDHLGVLSLDDGTINDLGIVGTNPQYSGTGHIVFGRVTGELFAVPFSLRSRTVQGPPVLLQPNVWVAQNGAVGAAVSLNGTLAYHSGEFAGNTRSLRIVGDGGAERPGPGGTAAYYAPRIAPDGQRVVVEYNEPARKKPTGPIVLLDVGSGAVQPIAAEGEGLMPKWTRDGRRVAFIRFLGEPGREIIARAWDRSGADTLLFRDSSAMLFDFGLGPAGGWSVLRRGGTGGINDGRDILLAPADSLARFRPLVATPAAEVSPAISPDGRWLAYASNESGRYETYVQPLPGPGPRLQVSITGGTEPLWSPQGGTLFYRSAERRIMAARLTGAPLRVVQWDTLFVDRYMLGIAQTNWSVFPSGREFLMVAGKASGDKMVVNWPQLPGLRRNGSTPP